MTKLGITVGMLSAFELLRIALQRVAKCLEQSTQCAETYREAKLTQLGGEHSQTLKASIAAVVVGHLASRARPAIPVHRAALGPRTLSLAGHRLADARAVANQPHCRRVPAIR